MSTPTDTHSDPDTPHPSSHTPMPSPPNQVQTLDTTKSRNDPNDAIPPSAQNQNPAMSTDHADNVEPAPSPDNPPLTVASAHPDETPPPSSSQPSADDGKLKENPEDTVSLSTVATNSQTPRNSRRKANKSSVSEGASASTSTNLHSPATNGKARVHPHYKPSFLLKLVHRIVPCIPFSSRVHDVEPDLSRPLPVHEKEKPTVLTDAPKDAVAPVVEDKPAPDTASPAQRIPTGPPLAPLVITPGSPPADAPDVILAPTPTLLPQSETEGVTSGAVQPPGSTGESIFSPHAHGHDHDHARAHSHDASADAGDESDETSFTEEEDVEESAPAEEEPEDEEDRLILNGGAGIPIGPDGVPRPLLPPIAPQHAGRKCLVLDLDETLVHSSFKSIQSADYVVPVEIEFHWHNVYVIKRPGVDNFLKKMGEIYEIVVFTASLSKYADPVLDKLDIHQVVSHRLFRESCYNHKGNYVKDLSQLGRPIADTIILDNSPASYIFHPNNAVPVSSWFNDPHDTELTDLVPFLSDLSTVDDVRGVLDGGL